MKSHIVWAVAGAVLIWLAQPPAALSLVAWIALVPWSLIVARPEPLGRRGWWALWACGSAYWLVTTQGVRLAHPALYPGWIALGLYLGAYPVLFVALSRVMTHQWNAPLWLAVPCVWTGLEWIRSYAFTGFSAVLLGHSQADAPLVAQVADLGGTYVVSFVIASVSGAVASGIAGGPQSTGPWSTVTRARTRRWGGVIMAGVLVLTAIGYGQWRLAQAAALADARPMLDVLLIQRNEPLVYSMSPEREAAVFNRYLQETLDAVANIPDAELVVWPESMYTAGLPYRILGADWVVPEELIISRAEFQHLVRSHQAEFAARAAEVRRLIADRVSGHAAPELLVGCSVYRYGPIPQAFGGAVHIDERSQVAAWYGKMHLVMFGEYIPFGDWFPWLYDVGPLSQGATPGDGPVVMDIDGVQIAPNICFETMVEHVTGNGLRRLDAEGESPELIVNITNDAWFHGSSILNHHRRCTQFVALANRRPLLMCANQGPTTWIDGSGRRIESMAFETDGFLHARPTRDSRWSLYQAIGDALVWPLGILCGGLAASHLWHRRPGRTPRVPH